jgi:hypothetical protein
MKADSKDYSKDGNQKQDSWGEDRKNFRQSSSPSLPSKEKRENTDMNGGNLKPTLQGHPGGKRIREWVEVIQR